MIGSWSPLSVAIAAVLVALSSGVTALFAMINPTIMRKVSLPLFAVAGACALAG